MTDYSNSSQQYYSIVISRPDGKGSISFRIKSWIAKSMLLGTAVTSLLLLFGLYFYTHTGVELATSRKLKALTTQQRDQIESINDQVDELKTVIEDLIDKEDQINTILEEERKPNRRRHRSAKPKPEQVFASAYSELPEHPHIKETVTEKISFLEDELAKVDTKISSHYQTIQALKTRFASIPSIWPIPIPSIWPERGRIKSRYGHRTHPITGKRSMHKGVDIPAKFGTPIKATADGVVEFSGWSRGGFGYMVQINHGFGYRTIYAHASQVLCKYGQEVKKGQVIALIGSTGLSTAPHLHYEVRRWRRAVKPDPYLRDMNMFTAGIRL